MRQRVATIVVLLLGFLIIGQSVYLTSQIDLNPVNEPMISSTATVSDINVAHITESTSLPAVHKYKTDLLLIPKKTIIYYPVPIANSFRFLPKVMESFGLLNERKYRSNYLP